MKKAIGALLALILLFSFLHPAKAQRIVLVQKNYSYTTFPTTSTTSDWAHFFILEGETEPQKAGYFGQHLRKFIQADTQAVKYLNSYAARQGVKLATTISTVVLFSAFAISNLSAERVAPENFDKPDKNRGLLYASFGTLAVNLILRLVPPRSIHKAVESYNQTLTPKLSLHSLYLQPDKEPGCSRLSLGVKFTIHRGS